VRGGVPAGVVRELRPYLLGREPELVAWLARWMAWPDFRLPRDRVAARAALVEDWKRSAVEGIEIGCCGGWGRTGIALACHAVPDGVGPADAVAYVRRHYHPRPGETPWQHRSVECFP
jgi:hypothetical protein